MTEHALMKLKRRDFLKLGALSATGLLLPLAGPVWGARSETSGPRLVVVFLRGAIDGLNVVAPFAEDHYYEYRPTIAVAKPGEPNGLIDLDGHFGLHPALSSLKPLWDTGELAFVHACGSPDPDRSHFEAQAYMETAAPGNRSINTGWINRLAAALDLKRAADTVAFGNTQPLITRGPYATTTFPNGKRAMHRTPMDRDPVQEAFSRLYLEDPRLGKIYQDALSSRHTLLTALSQDMENSSQGAPLPEGFAADAARAAKMMRYDSQLRLLFFQLGGWDTHVNEGAGQGQLANHLKPLGEGLVVLKDQLGKDWDNTLVLVMSEFGRTAHENGNRGTDHGHGNVHWVMGGAVAGGKVYGDWPGLDESALHQNRDLQVTTDFRSLLDEMLIHHFGLDEPMRSRILPNFITSNHHLKGLFRA